MDAEGNADPLMLLYRTLDVHTPDIARVVLSIHDLRMLAKHMDERLTPYLLEDCHGYDYAIASLLSVHGKGLKYLTTQTQAYHVIEQSGGRKFNMKELMTGEPRQGNEPGINLPD
jgi:hypothetical protein